MKTLTKKIFTVVFITALLVCAMAVTASAATTGTTGTTSNGLKYIISDGQAEITYCSETNSIAILTIPSTIEGCPVTRIGFRAFDNCTYLTKVIIPNSVESIDAYAFEGCTSLASITIGNNIKNIAEQAFYYTAYYNNSDNWKNGVLYIGGCLIEAKNTLSGSYTIKDGTKLIANFAFYGCKSLKSITIPDSVTSIGDYAFSRCTSIAKVTIGNNVTSIGYSAFYDTAYYNSSNNWKNGVLYVGNYLIEAKSTIFGSYTIKRGTKLIVPYAFRNCTSLTGVSIPSGVTSIGPSAFYGCTSLKNASIPQSVTIIGDAAFRGCTNLKNVTIGNSVKSIGGYTFYGCTNLTCVTIGNSVKNIGEYAFYSCTSLTSVTFGKRVKTIEDYAFCLCSSLANVHITDLSAWCKISFGHYSNPLGYAGNLHINGKLATDITIPSGVTSIGSSAFLSCTSLKKVTIPKSVTSIGSGAFSSCINLTSVKIPDSVKSIGSGAFAGCESLTRITIPSSVKSIGDVAFQYCTGLTSITIPQGVTSIGDYTFFCCGSIKSVTIPKSVKSIGRSAFFECKKIATVYYEGTKVQWNSIDVDIDNESLKNVIVKYNYCYHKYTNKCDTTCNRCNATRTITHTYKTTTTRATLTKNGSIVKKCTVCGKVASKTVIKYAKTFKLAANTFVYNGKARTPAVTVKDSAGKVLKKGVDYTVTYAAGRKNVGTYKVTIKMKGNYTGTKVLTFKINPQGVALKTLKTGVKSFTAAWAPKTAQVTGYEIQYSVKKNFSGAKKVTVTSNKTKNKVVKSLKAGKKYFVRIRTYKTVGKVKFYSAWSAAKYVTPRAK